MATLPSLTESLMLAASQTSLLVSCARAASASLHGSTRAKPLLKMMAASCAWARTCACQQPQRASHDRPLPARRPRPHALLLPARHRSRTSTARSCTSWRGSTSPGTTPRCSQVAWRSTSRRSRAARCLGLGRCSVHCERRGILTTSCTRTGFRFGLRRSQTRMRWSSPLSRQA